MKKYSFWILFILVLMLDFSEQAETITSKAQSKSTSRLKKKFAAKSAKILLENFHEDNLSKWRCSFRCGPGRPKELGLREINICNDVCYSFYLSVGREDENSEKIAVEQCTQYFEDITSVHYVNAVSLCNQTKCNPPLARELLPPENYRNTAIASTDSADKKNKKITLKTDPLIMAKIAEEERQSLEDQWWHSNMRVTEDVILEQLDHKLMNIKSDICTKNSKNKEKAELLMEKFLFFVDQLNGDENKDRNKTMLLAISSLVNIKPEDLVPFMNSINEIQTLKITELLRKLGEFLKKARKSCNPRSS